MFLVDNESRGYQYGDVELSTGKLMPQKWIQ